MHKPLRPDEVNHLVGDRIHDLYDTASQLRAAREAGSPASTESVGLVTRTRWTIGRHLISIGSAVAGQHA